MSPLVSIWFSGLGAVLIAMGLVWCVSLVRRDASIIDVFWGPGFALVAWVYATSGGGWPRHELLALAMVSLWGLRLAAHILWRSRGRGEDYRYVEMRERRGARFWWVSLFTVFLFQALLLWLISAPLLQTIVAPRPADWNAFEMAALVLFVIGFLFEAVGDLQLARFRSDRDQHGKVLRSGLWRYTRHPNYFGDAVRVVELLCPGAGHARVVVDDLQPLAHDAAAVEGLGCRLAREETETDATRVRGLRRLYERLRALVSPSTTRSRGLSGCPKLVNLGATNG